MEEIMLLNVGVVEVASFVVYILIGSRHGSMVHRLSVTPTRSH